MGFTAVVGGTGSSISAGAGSVPLYLSLGVGIGSLFVAVALITVLAYYELLKASTIDEHLQRRLRDTLLATIFPLLLTFTAIVIFESLQLLSTTPR